MQEFNPGSTMGFYTGFSILIGSGGDASGRGDCAGGEVALFQYPHRIGW